METEFTKVEELNQLGDNLMQAGKVKEALDYYEKAEAEEPNCKDTYLKKGIAYAALQEYDAAIEELHKVLKLDKANCEAYVQLFRIYFLQGNYKEAIMNANIAIDNGEEDPDLYFHIAKAYERLKEHDRAIRNYNKAISLNQLEGKYYVEKSKNLVRRRKFEDALETLADLNKYCPDAFEAYHYSFLIYMQAGEYVMADKVINTGLEMFPTDVSLYYDKLRILNVVKEFDAALELIGLLKQLPGFAAEERNILVEEARVYLQTERTEKAAEVLEKVINMDGAQTFEAHYLLMNTYLSMQRLEDVVRIARIMTDADDNSTYARSAYYYEAMSLLKMNKTADSKQCYKKAIEKYRLHGLKHPEDLDTYMFRALCHKDIGEYEKALNVLDYALKLRNDFAPIHLIRSNVYKDMGREQEAQQELNQAKELDGSLEMILQLTQ